MPTDDVLNRWDDSPLLEYLDKRRANPSRSPRTTVRIDGILDDGLPATAGTYGAIRRSPYYGFDEPSFQRFTPFDEAKAREDLRAIGIVTCTCRGFDGKAGRQILIDPRCPVHTDRCYACGQVRP